jgi:hypothetical protein
MDSRKLAVPKKTNETPAPLMVCNACVHRASSIAIKSDDTTGCGLDTNP